MAEDVVQGIKRYGFPPTPYLRRRTLDPQGDASLCMFAGLTPSIQRLKDYIAEAATADEPAFVMVSGRSGSGRTSAGNHLLAAYRHARGIAPERFAVPRDTVAGDDDFDVLTNWITDLYGELQQRPKLTPLGSAGTLDLDVALDNAGNLARETYRTKARNWMTLTAKTLAVAGGGFGVCLEDVPSFQTVDAAVAVFARTPTLVVFTIFDSQQGVRDQFESLPVTTNTQPPDGDRYPVLDLYEVQGQDAEDLIESRWPEGTRPSPFNGAQLAAAFVKPRSAGRIMVLTGRLLGTKAAAPGPPWPADDLRFGAHELPGLVDEWDKWIKET